MSENATPAQDAVPRFRRGVKLRFDEARGHWVLLAPEKAFVPDPIAAEILQLIDGQRSIAQMAENLASRFDAPLATVQADTTTILSDLAARGALEL